MLKHFLLFSLLIFTNISPILANSYKYAKIENALLPDDMPIFDENNEKHFMDEYEGSPILLVFWASWCSGCSNEMVSLDILQKDFRKLNFKIIPVSVDYAGMQPAIDFYKQYEIRYLPILHDYKNALFKAISVTSLPTALIVDSDGNIKGKFTGEVPWHDDSIRAQLLKFIPNNPATPKNTYKKESLDQKVRSMQ